jgi:hypothetical protein
MNVSRSAVRWQSAFVRVAAFSRAFVEWLCRVVKRACCVVATRYSSRDAGNQSTDFHFGLSTDSGNIGGKRGQNGACFRLRFDNDGGTTRGRGQWDILLRLVINVIQVCRQAMRHLGQTAAHCGERIVDTGNVAVIDRKEPVLADHGHRQCAFGDLLQLPGRHAVLLGSVLVDHLLALKILRHGRRCRHQRRPHPLR